MASPMLRGTLSTGDYLKKVIAYLQLEGDPTALFRHPDDDWMARLLKGRGEAEKERMRAVLEAAFPKAMGRVARERKAIPCPSNGVL